MALDPRYLLSPNLQQYFVDKDTGFPLAGGKVYIWQDNNRSVPMPAYQISGSPPNYTFTPLPNPIILSSVGTVQDGGGNDIVPYLFPLDLQGNVQLAYIEVYSSGNVLQFVRPAWPPEAAQSQGVQQETSTLNLIPNGQFAIHNDIPANIITGTPTGRVTTPVTQVAAGGWTFERPAGSTAVDSVIFNRINGFTTDPSGSPRYEIVISTNGGSPIDAFKDLRKTYQDVNKFSSDTQAYTVFFSARTFTGGTFDLALNIVKNYGTGGDPEEVINIATFTITGTQQNFVASFMWGDNSGKLIGPNNDDFCQLAFSLPTGTSLDFAATDFANLIGDVNILTFPTTTTEDFIARSVIPSLPRYDGSTLGLPLIYTKNGVDFDYSQVGNIYASVKSAPGLGEYLCDGTTYRTDSFSPDGIPHSRINNVLSGFAPLNTTQGMSLFGNGRTYVTCSRGGTSNQIIILANNSAGMVTAVSDGASPTGFTFNTLYSGISAARQNSWMTGGANGGAFWVQNFAPGTNAASYANGVAGSNISMTADALVSRAAHYLDQTIGEIYGGGATSDFLKVTSLNNTLPVSSSYLYLSIPGGPATNDTVLWFSLNGTGAQPALGTRFYIRANIFSTMTKNDVMYISCMILNGAQVTYINPVAGASIPANSYFTFMAPNGQNYYVWYNLNGTGIDPSIGGLIGVPVTYTNSSTISDIALSTSIAINRVNFAVPNMQGQMVKGYDPTATVDVNKGNRFNPVGSRLDLVGFQGYLGSNQYNSNLGHSHPFETGSPGATGTILANRNSGHTALLDDNAGPSGTGSNDPYNLSFNYFIKI